MEMNHLIAGALSAQTLSASSGFATKAPTIQQQLEAMQKALAEQQAQLEAQRKQLADQQAELQALRAAAPALVSRASSPAISTIDS